MIRLHFTKTLNIYNNWLQIWTNSQYLNIRFPVEAENNGALSFLLVKINRKNGKFVTSVHRKETFSGVYAKFISFITLEYNFVLSYTHFHRCFGLVSDILKFHMELEKLYKFFSKMLLSLSQKLQQFQKWNLELPCLI